MSDLDSIDKQAGVTDSATSNNLSIGDLSIGVTTGATTFVPDNSIVSARGTEEGLVLRIDGSAEWDLVIREVDTYLQSRRKFFEGAEASIEWIDRLPDKQRCSELEQMLKSSFGLEVVSGRKRHANRADKAATKSIEQKLVVKDIKSYLKNGKLAKAGESVASADQGTREDSTQQVLAQRSATIESRIARAKMRAEQGESASARTGGNSELEQIELLANSGLGQAKLERTVMESLEQDRLAASAADHDLSADNLFGAKLSGETLLSSMELLGDRLFGDSMSGSNLGNLPVGNSRKVVGEDIFCKEEADARLFFGTVRSGQKIETPFSLVIVGDVNPGSDLIAGGDIIVLGSLRGTAHAAAYDDDCFDRIIFALQMQPMQLRIGSIISRGSKDSGGGPEIAKIDNRRIIVESYRARSGISRK